MRRQGVSLFLHRRFPVKTIPEPSSVFTLLVSMVSPSPVSATLRRTLIRRCLTSNTPKQPPVKLGLGGQNYGRLEPQRYQSIVQTALDSGVDLLEAGQEGGDAVLAGILRQVKLSNTDKLTVTTRYGYRTLQHSQPDIDALREAGDITVETQSEDYEQSPEQAMEEQGNNDEEQRQRVIREIVHNISPGYIQKTLEQSALVQLRQEAPFDDMMDLVYMVHNPEVHVDASDADVLLDKLTDSFCGLEQAVLDKQISSFGVVSNGLSLPADHPLNLPWRTILLEAASQAAKEVKGENNASSLSTIQLPMNVLEPKGLQVAKDVQAYLKESHSNLPSALNVYAMRPLTCYPDFGMGTSQPYRMIDYPIPMGDKIVYTNELEGPPPTYQKALNEALSHFDGVKLLEAKEERELTVEEKETLEGCRLLQSIIHDLDVGLEKVTSFAEHEDELVSKVIPIIYGHFEEFDEESSDVLQHFFHAHGLAVRHAIAQHMREKLERGTKNIEPYDVPKDMKLQEFALDQLLKEDAVTKVIVGCSHPIQVLEHVEAARALLHDAYQQ